jgi:hypothetical protein
MLRFLGVGKYLPRPLPDFPPEVGFQWDWKRWSQLGFRRRVHLMAQAWAIQGKQVCARPARLTPRRRRTLAARCPST